MKSRGIKGDKPGDNLGHRNNHNLGKIKPPMSVSKFVCPKFVHPNQALPFRKKPQEILMQPPMIDDQIDGTTTESILLSTAAQSPTCAILDTGASRCIIGEKTLKRLQSHLPPEVCSKLKTSPSQIKFRFGNEQSLTSSHRIHFPLKAVDRRTVWLAVEVVPGGTPFLLSKRAFKMLGGLLDAVQDICYMKRLHHEPIPLSFSNTGLYLVNVGDLCQGVSNLEEKCYQAYVGKTCFDEKVKHAGLHGKKFAPSFQKLPGHVDKQMNRKFNFTNKAIFVPSALPNALDRNPTRSDAVGGEPIQGCGRVPDPGDDNAVADAYPAPRGQLSKQPDGRSAPRDHSADPSDDGRTADSTCFAGEHQPPMSDPTRYFDSCKSRAIETCLQDQADARCQGQSSAGKLCQKSQVPDTIERFCSDDVVPRRVRQRGDRGGGRTGNCSPGSPTGASHDAFASSRAFRGVGYTSGDLGQETQREELRSHDPSGSSVLRLVPKSIHVVDSRDAGLRALWPDASEQTVSPVRSSQSRNLEDPDFHAQVLLTRHELTKEPPKVQFSDELIESVCKAESTFDQHIMERQWNVDSTRNRVFLLEVYAGTSSPLADAVEQFGTSEPQIYPRRW